MLQGPLIPPCSVNCEEEVRPYSQELISAGELKPLVVLDFRFGTRPGLYELADNTILGVGLDGKGNVRKSRSSAVSEEHLNKFGSCNDCFAQGFCISIPAWPLG